MKKELICILCPHACLLQTDMEEAADITVNEITGHLCEKGPTWAEQELMNPVRTIASSIRVESGDFPLVSVRTDAPIPLHTILDVMNEIKSLKTRAPIRIGEILIKNPAGTPCNIIATRNVNRAS